MRHNKLRLVHLTSTINGGAGKATQKIHNMMISQGFNSSLIVGQEIKNKNFFFRLKFELKKIIKIFIPKFILVKRKNKKYNKYVSAYCFYQKNELKTKGINRQLLQKISKIDILFIHWVSDFVNIHDIKYFKSKFNCRIIFVMLDHAHVSGGYHFLLNEYNNYLDNNNIKINRPEYLLYSKQLEQKGSILNQIPTEILVFSNKDLQIAKDSPLKFKNYWRTVIPIENEIFYPIWDAKKDSSLKTIFSCAYDLSDFRKGSVIFIKVLKHLDNLLRENQKIRVLCSKYAPISDLNLKNIFFDFFEFSNNPVEYSKLYHQSDIFIFSSIADSAPQMPSEALYSGLPVVSFNIANISEIVTDENDGFIVDNFDDEIMANKSYELLYETNKINSKENKLKRYHKIKRYHEPRNIMRYLDRVIRKGV